MALVGEKDLPYRFWSEASLPTPAAAPTFGEVPGTSLGSVTWMTL